MQWRIGVTEFLSYAFVQRAIVTGVLLGSTCAVLLASSSNATTSAPAAASAVAILMAARSMPIASREQN